MENLKIEIIITDGDKKAKTTIKADEYQIIKKLHGISLLDEQVDILLDEIKKA